MDLMHQFSPKHRDVLNPAIQAHCVGYLSANTASMKKMSRDKFFGISWARCEISSLVSGFNVFLNFRLYLGDHPI